MPKETAMNLVLKARAWRGLTRRQTIRRWIFPISLLAAASTTVAQRAPRDEPLPDLAARIEALAVPQAEAELLSGVILVARRDQILFQQAYGFANWEHRIPNSRPTRFGIASVTKTMTEALVEVLAAAGRIDVSVPVEKYLPGFPKGPNGAVPTIGQLLAHRSGVPHRVTEPIDETQPLRPSDIVRRVRARGLLFEPGTRRLYSSAGYTCLARVIEVIEEKPFDQILAERIFGPAGMASAVGETGQRLMPRRATPYRLGAGARRVVVKSAPYKDLRFLTGAGSVYATAEDLLRFVRGIRAGIFGPKLRDRTFGADPKEWAGWTGRTNGYEASVDVLPAENLIFVFLSNLQSASNWQLRARIQHILVGREAVAIPLPPPVAAQFERPESLVGSYGPAQITLVDETLFRGDNEFYPIDGRSYYIPASGSIMKFRRDARGDVDAIIANDGGGRETILPRSTRP